MKFTDAAIAVLRNLKTIDEVQVFLRAYQMGWEANFESKPEPEVVQEVPPLKPRRTSHNRGAQASVYRMLSTGPASLDALCRALPSYPREVIRHSLGRMIAVKDASEALDRPGGIDVVSLTPAGKVKASWFVSHPEARLCKS